MFLNCANPNCTVPMVAVPIPVGYFSFQPSLPSQSQG
jgi:hypothetical protein